MGLVAVVTGSVDLRSISFMAERSVKNGTLALPYCRIRKTTVPGA